MKLNEFFTLEEFLSQQAYQDFMRLLRICTFIREKSNQRVIINNWHVGGKFTQRGLRLPYDITGAPHSQHRLFRAVDINIGNWSSQSMYEFVIAHKEVLYQLGLRRIEHPDNTPGWLHLDVKEHGEKCFHVFSPEKVLFKISV